MKTREISIVGFGRFGQLLASILCDDFTIKVYDKKTSLKQYANHSNVQFVDITNLLESQTIFYCVPISDLENTMEEHLTIYKNMSETKLIIDVLSVKLHPQKIFQKLLPSHYEILLTHPMFGPESVKVRGLEGQAIVMDQNTTSDHNYLWWKDYFKNKKLNVVEMPADDHDRLAARSQGIAHLIGRTLDQFGLAPTPIDTIGAKDLYSIKEQTCKNSWQLFEDIQTYNPYTSQMRNDLAQAFKRTSEKLNKQENYVC